MVGFGHGFRPLLETFWSPFGGSEGLGWQGTVKCPNGGLGVASFEKCTFVRGLAEGDFRRKNMVFG